eukprot:gene13016-27467_t
MEINSDLCDDISHLTCPETNRSDPDVAKWACQSIANFWLQNDRPRNHETDRNIFNVIIEALMEHASLPDVVIEAFRCITIISESSITELFSLGACKSVTRCIKINSTSPIVMEWGCRAIISVSRTNNNIQTKMGSSKAFSILADGIKGNITNADCCEWMWKAMHCLSLNNIENTESICQCNIHGLILDSLIAFESNTEVVEWACRLIAVIAEHNIDNQLKFIKVNASSKIIRILWTYVANASVSDAVCIAISSLNNNSDIDIDSTTEGHSILCTNTTINSTATSTVCEAIMHVLRLHYLDIWIAESGCRALCSLSLNNEECQMKLGEIGASTVLLAILHHQNNSAVIIQCLAAMNILINHPDIKSKFTTTNKCKALLPALFTNISNVTISYEGCKLITSLSTHEQSKHDLVHLGAWEVIIEILRKHSSVGDVVLEACRAFYSLSEDGLIQCSELISVLKLHLSDPFIVTEACQALNFIANDIRQNKSHVNTIEPIIVTFSILNVHINDAIVVQHACKAISTLAILNFTDPNGAINAVALQENIRTVMSTTCICELVIRSLQQHSVCTKVAEIGCITIFILAKNPKNRNELIKVRGRQVVDSILAQSSMSECATVNARNAKEILRSWFW